MFTVFRTLLLAFSRDVLTIFWAVVLPVGLLIGLGLYFDTSAYRQQLLAGVLAVSVLFGVMFVASFDVLGQRNRGVYKLLRVTPFQTARFISAMTAARTLLSLMISALVVVTSIVLFDVSFSLGSVLKLILVISVGTFCFAAVGVVVANFARNEAQVSMIANIVSMPMIFTSEAFYSMANAPRWLQVVGDILPFSYFVNTIRATVDPSTGGFWSSLLILLGFTVIAFLLATVTFRWDSDAQLVTAFKRRKVVSNEIS